MKKKLLILAGGFSREREISLKTAKAVFQEIKNNYITKISEPDGNLVNTLRKFKPDFVFNALHGRYGEDGYIQLILENERIKYTHSGVEASSVCINKIISKEVFIKNKINTPKYIILRESFINNLKQITKIVQKKLI